MEIRIMLFIVMMMVMPVSYAACYSELSVQHNLVVQGDFALTQTQMATYEHNFNDSSCVSTNTITPMSPSDIIVGLYNDTIKLNLHFEWTNKNNITLSNNQTSFTSGYSVTVTPAASNAKVNVSAGGGGSVMINGVATLSSASSSTRGSAAVQFLLAANAIPAAQTLARETGAIVVVTGEVDYVTDGHRIIGIHGGDPLMTKVVGTGCALSAVVAACCALPGDTLENIASACHWMKQAGERAVARSEGPGSFVPHFLDALWQLTQEVQA